MFTTGIPIQWCQNHLFIIKNEFSDLKLNSLCISAFFNKKKNFDVSNFWWAQVWKMTVATPWPIDFAKIFSNCGKMVKTRSHVGNRVEAYQNTKRNFQKYELWRHNDVITKNNGKIRTSVKQGKS